MLKNLTVLLFLSFIVIINSCSTKREDQMVKKDLYGKLSDGREVHIYTLKNKSGAEARIINFGAIVTNLFVKDKNGNVHDIVLGYDSLEGYVNDKSYFGAIVGRFGNRIDMGKFTLDSKEYQLTINDGRNQLHGGPKGFNKVLWGAEPVESQEGPSVKLTYNSKDGEEGYPGNLTLTIVYTLTDDNELKIDYTGTTDKPTVVNPTHHSYFNLSGDLNNTILDHELFIDADSITPVDSHLIPTGEIRPIAGTPMDFTTPAKIGSRINEDYDQLKFGLGYDHNWVLNDYKEGSVRKIAVLSDSKTGMVMEVLSDQPGVQFYSGNFLNGTVRGKGGVVYKHRTGLCLEAQHYPDSPNKPQFPSVVLRPGETYHQTTVYRFTTK